jgi:hypothetical protein
MPLLVFLVLGTLQLFMLLQARILTQHAAYRAVRAGSLNQGDCVPMMDMAIVTLLPTLDRTDNATELARAFRRHKDNRIEVNGHRGPMVEIVRQSPRPNDFVGPDDAHFDDPSARPGGPLNLEIRMVYWYYMKIPFANRVMSWIFLAHFGLRDFRGQNPLVFTDRDEHWRRSPGASLSGASWPGGPIARRMRNWANQEHYLFPIEVNAVMRMMTPARRQYFSRGQDCPLR